MYACTILVAFTFTSADEREYAVGTCNEWCSLLKSRTYQQGSHVRQEHTQQGHRPEPSTRSLDTDCGKYAIGAV